MKHKKQFWLFLTALVIVFCGLFNTQSIKAAYSNKQLRSYAQKTMRKNHLRGSIVIVKNGHRQTVNVRKYWLNISTLFYLNTFSYLIFVY